MVVAKDYERIAEHHNIVFRLIANYGDVPGCQHDCSNGGTYTTKQERLTATILRATSDGQSDSLNKQAGGPNAHGGQKANR